MENLFYGCDISDKFDLKGSERNRRVDPSNTNGEIVLLDENLVNSKYHVIETWLQLLTSNRIALQCPGRSRFMYSPTAKLCCAMPYKGMPRFWSAIR